MFRFFGKKKKPSTDSVPLLDEVELDVAPAPEVANPSPARQVQDVPDAGGFNPFDRSNSSSPVSLSDIPPLLSPFALDFQYDSDCTTSIPPSAKSSAVSYPSFCASWERSGSEADPDFYTDNEFIERGLISIKGFIFTGGFRIPVLCPEEKARLELIHTRVLGNQYSQRMAARLVYYVEHVGKRDGLKLNAFLLAVDDYTNIAMLEQVIEMLSGKGIDLYLTAKNGFRDVRKVKFVSCVEEIPNNVQTVIHMGHISLERSIICEWVKGVTVFCMDHICQPSIVQQKYTLVLLAMSSYTADWMKVNGAVVLDSARKGEPGYYGHLADKSSHKVCNVGVIDLGIDYRWFGDDYGEGLRTFFQNSNSLVCLEEM